MSTPSPQKSLGVAGSELPLSVIASQPPPSCCSGGDQGVGAIQVQPLGGWTWEQRRALNNGDSLVLEPTLTGRGPCDSGAFLFDDDDFDLPIDADDPVERFPDGEFDE